MKSVKKNTKPPPTISERRKKIKVIIRNTLIILGLLLGFAAITDSRYKLKKNKGSSKGSYDNRRESIRRKRTLILNQMKNIEKNIDIRENILTDAASHATGIRNRTIRIGNFDLVPPQYQEKAIDDLAKVTSDLWRLSDKMQKAHKEIGNLDSYAYFNEIDTKARKLRKKAYTLAQERQMMLDVIRDIYYKEYKNKRLQ